jgi:VCBS repeat-containing protein
VTVSGNTITVDPADVAFQYLGVGDSELITVNYEVVDAQGATVAQTATITVNGTNDAPVAVADGLSATEDTVSIFTAADLLGNDIDVDNLAGDLSISSVTSGTGGTAVLNIDGTVTFTPDSDFDGAAEFTYTITDGALESAAATATVTVDQINDAPVLTIPDLTTVFISRADVTASMLQQAEDFVDIRNALIDSGMVPGAYHLRADPIGTGNGTGTSFQAVPADGADGFVSTATPETGWNYTDVDGDGSDTISFSEIFRYRSVEDYNSTQDLGQSMQYVVDYSVPVPVFVEDGGAVVIAPTVAASDIDDTNLEGATISITSGFQTGEDALGFADQNGITGSYSAVTGILTLTGTTTVVQYQAALASVTFANTSDDPDTTDREISFTVNDGDAYSTPVTSTVALTPINDAPMVVVGGTAAYVENSAGVAVGAGISLADADDTDLESASVAITGGFVAGEDALSFANQNGITGSYNAATGILALSGTATVAQYQAAMASVSYANSSDDPDTSDRTVSFTVNDGDVDSAVATSTVTVAAVNDAPSILGSTSVGATTVNDIQDYNVPNSTGNGGFNSAYNGLPGGQIDGRAITDFATGDVITVTLTGVNYFFALYDGVNNVLAPFDGLYSNQHTSGFTGSYTVTGGADTTLRWFLGGNNQTGGNPSYSVTASAVTGGLDVNEDTSGLFTGLSIADPDVGTSDLSVTLDVANGDLALTSIAGLTQTDADGTDGTLAFSGSLADVNAALAGLEYTGDDDFNGQDFLNIAVDDGGNTGTGGAMSDAKSVVINVEAVNDAPVAVGDTGAVSEDGTLVASGTVTATDVDTNDTHTFAIQGTGVGTYGSIVITDAATGAWEYTLDNTDSAVQDLDTGDLMSDTFIFVADDGNGGTDTATISVDVAGADEAAVLGTTVDYSYLFPSTGSSIYNTSFEITSGVELSGLFGAGSYATVDVQEDGIFVDFYSSATWSTASFNGFRISDNNDVLAEIQDVYLNGTNMSGLTDARVTFDDDNIWVNWNGLNFDSNTYVDIGIDFA